MSFSLYGQNQSKIDSLKNELQKSDLDTNQVNILNNLAKEELGIRQLNTADQHANKALRQSEELNFNSGMIVAYKVLGVISIIRGDFDEAIDYSEKGLETCDKEKRIKDKADILVNLGIAYSHTGNFEQSITRRH